MFYVVVYVDRRGKESRVLYAAQSRDLLYNACKIDMLRFGMPEVGIEIELARVREVFDEAVADEAQAFEGHSLVPVKRLCAFDREKDGGHNVFTMKPQEPK